MTYLKHTFFFFLIALPLFVRAENICTDTSKFESDINLDSFILKLHQDSFTTYNKKEAIPRVVKKDLDRLTGNFSIANPNQQYACCCTSSPHLPKRQLNFLSKSNDVIAMEYETGGIATSDHILLIQFNAKGIIGLWSGYGAGDIKSAGDMEAFLKWKIKKDPNIAKTIVYL